MEKMIKNGWYVAELIGTRQQFTRDSQCVLVIFTWEISEGKHKGVKIDDFFHINSCDPYKEKDARLRLSRICGYVGFSEILHDTDQLLHSKLIIAVGMKYPKGYMRRNIIRDYGISPGAGRLMRSLRFRC